MQASAADLLQWMDANSSVQVMSQVQSCLSAYEPPFTAPVPVALEVDVTALMCDDVQLATTVMQNTRDIASKAEVLINQQLEMQAAAALNPVEEDMETAAPSVRLNLQLTQVPLPLSSTCEVQQQAVQLSSCPTAPSCGLLASMLAVVVGASPPAERTQRARFSCPACGNLVDVLATDSCLPCCNLPKASMGIQEDLTGRVMVPAQQLWVSELSSAAGSPAYGTSSQPLLVHVPEHQVGSCGLGSVVHVIGNSVINMQAAAAAGRAGGTGAACSIQVHANNIQPVLPHLLWQLPPACTPSITSSHSQQPLHTLWQLLSTALGCQQPIDPNVAVAMLLSAAAVGGRTKQQHSAAEQVSLLVLHDSFAPATLRMLKEAAALLSPQSVAMPVQLAEHVTPITGSSSGCEAADDASVKPVFASILHLANAGVAVADLPTMRSKARQQLLSVLQQRATPQPKGAPANLPLPLTATCWGAAAWQDVCPSGGGEWEAYGRPARQTAAAKNETYQGFDLCVGDGTVHEDELYWLLDVCGSSGQQQHQLEQQKQEAAASLRHLVAAAACCQGPVLSDAAQAFLGQYFLLLRQSLCSSSSKVSKPVLLASLVRVASAVARLHCRSEVLEQPDAALAVLLMEHTLANKLGDGYHTLLELPCDLHPMPGSNRSLDEQVALLHGIMARAFKQHCNTDGDEYGCGAEEGSDCSGLGGGHGGGCGVPGED